MCKRLFGVSSPHRRREEATRRCCRSRVLTLLILPRDQMACRGDHKASTWVGWCAAGGAAEATARHGGSLPYDRIGRFVCRRRCAVWEAGGSRLSTVGLELHQRRCRGWGGIEVQWLKLSKGWLTPTERRRRAQIGRWTVAGVALQQSSMQGCSCGSPADGPRSTMARGWNLETAARGTVALVSRS